MEESLLLSLIDATIEKKFDYVYESLGEASKKQYLPLVRWAITYGLTYKNGDVRDLAGKILEKAPIPELTFDHMREQVAEAMNVENENPYAQYHFAFALAAHGPGRYRPEVMLVLENALNDKEVSDIAEGYLKKLVAAKPA